MTTMYACRRGDGTMGTGSVALLEEYVPVPDEIGSLNGIVQDSAPQKTTFYPSEDRFLPGDRAGWYMWSDTNTKEKPMGKTLTTGRIYDTATLKFAGWTHEGVDGYNEADYFEADGTYLGADVFGVEPLYDGVSTDAERIAERFDNDGMTWTDAEGNDFAEVCDELASDIDNGRHDRGDGDYRYTFADDSVIVVLGDCWDLGYTDCWCMRGAGHSDTCGHGPRAAEWIAAFNEAAGDDGPIAEVDGAQVRIYDDHTDWYGDPQEDGRVRFEGCGAFDGTHTPAESLAIYREA